MEVKQSEVRGCPACAAARRRYVGAWRRARSRRAPHRRPTRASRSRRRMRSPPVRAASSGVSMGKKPQVSFKSAPQGIQPEEARGPDEADQSDGFTGVGAARRAAQPPRPEGEEPAGHGDPGARGPVLLDAEERAGPAEADAAPRRGLRRARVSGVPRQDRGGRSRRTRPSGKNPKAVAGMKAEIGKADKILSLARKQAIKYYTDLKDAVSEVLPEHQRGRPREEHGLHGRGPLLPRLRVRAGPAARGRSQGLLRADQELAATRSTSRTRTSPSASSSSTRRRATRQVGPG